MISTYLDPKFKAVSYGEVTTAEQARNWIIGEFDVEQIVDEPPPAKRPRIEEVASSGHWSLLKVQVA